MQARLSTPVNIFFGAIILTIGLLNLFLVHPVPGAVCLVLFLLYFPPAIALLKEKFNIAIPLLLKVAVGIVVIWFTLGVSDLGDMLDGALLR